MTLIATQYESLEWGYTSGKAYVDPFNEVELDVVVTHESGKSWRLPAYWAGENEWRVRFAPPVPGSYLIKTICSDIGNSSLEAVTGELYADPYGGESPLLLHGPLRVTEDRRTLQFSDGTPFFGLGDTWWMGLCKRLAWPDEFQMLAADRLAKGYTIIQIVAGLYPDMPGFDPRGRNECGFPWEPEYERINPVYFDMADLRIRWLVRQGLVPCIVGCWGYYLPLLGVEKMKQHWRYLVARWSSYPVVWCLAGEALMPYYLSENKPLDEKIQFTGWTELARYVRDVDPFHRLITIHPTQVGRDQVSDDTLLDVNILQTGHDGYRSVPNTVAKVSQEYQRAPAMPVVVGEPNYEGIIHSSEAEFQRLSFWAAMLSGGYGYTYAANGLWQLNTREQPYGPSPHGATWGEIPWDEAYRLPGSAQLGLAKGLLSRYKWWCFEPHPEWVGWDESIPESGYTQRAQVLKNINGIDNASTRRFHRRRMNTSDPFSMDISRHTWETRYRAAGEADIRASWQRGAQAIAQAERGEREAWATRLYSLLEDFRFLPGGRILAGAGTGTEVTYYNCYVIPVETKGRRLARQGAALADATPGDPGNDSREAIFDTIGLMVDIMSRGGGVGINWSVLRPKGAKIHVFGKKSDPQELVQKVTASTIDSAAYVRYLTRKFSDIYGL